MAASHRVLAWPLPPNMKIMPVRVRKAVEQLEQAVPVASEHLTPVAEDQLAMLQPAYKPDGGPIFAKPPSGVVAY